MIALGATKKYRSTHEHDGISFKSMFIFYRKNGDRYIDKEGRKEEKREGERREEGNTFKGNIKLTLWHLEACMLFSFRGFIKIMGKRKKSHCRWIS